MSGQVFNFQRHPRKGCSSYVTIWTQKKTTLEEGWVQKKMVKVEEGEEDGNDKSTKFWKDCNVKALIVVCQWDGVPKLL